MHSALLISWRRKTVMIDFGADWSGKAGRVNPDAILITHAHPDHAAGLRGGAPCPVYATADTWSRIQVGPISEKVVVRPRLPVDLFGIRFEAFPVAHSIRAPAVGYRFTAGRHSVFYVPDLVRIRHQALALQAIQLYIGDGASITRPILRKRGNARIGHTSIRTQLNWCRKEGVPRAIFSHCGSEIVTGNQREVADQVRTLGMLAGVDASIAHDGLRVTL
jgi:phosphoribosyl 1,2-cyclic phosphodiesterase